MTNINLQPSFTIQAYDSLVSSVEALTHDVDRYIKCEGTIVAYKWRR